MNVEKKWKKVTAVILVSDDEGLNEGRKQQWRRESDRLDRRIVRAIRCRHFGMECLPGL